MKGHTIITNSLSQKSHIHKANVDLINFREKFNDWKMVYEREIQKTKKSLANMTPTLQGLSVAARIHKISDKAIRSLNTSPCRSATPSSCSKIPSPRGDSSTSTTTDCSHSKLSNEEDFLSSVSSTENESLNESLKSFEYQEFEKAQKLMEVTKNIDNLTTIIDRKILATRVLGASSHGGSQDGSVYSWNEQEVSVVNESQKSNSANNGNLKVSVDVNNSTLGGQPQTNPDHLPEHMGSRRRIAHGFRSKEPPAKPINLRDNLIILDKQRKLREEGAELTVVEHHVITPGRREDALMLLKKMYSPSLSTNSSSSQQSTTNSSSLHSTTSSSSLHSNEESATRTPVNETLDIQDEARKVRRALDFLTKRDQRVDDRHAVSKVIAGDHQRSVLEIETRKMSIAEEHSKTLFSTQAHQANSHAHPSQVTSPPDVQGGSRDKSANFNPNFSESKDTFASDETSGLMKSGSPITKSPEVVIRRSGIEITPSIFENLNPLGITIY